MSQDIKSYDRDSSLETIKRDAECLNCGTVHLAGAKHHARCYERRIFSGNYCLEHYHEYFVNCDGCGEGVMVEVVND